MYPDNILTDDSSPERGGLNKTWPSVKYVLMCISLFTKHLAMVMEQQK